MRSGGFVAGLVAVLVSASLAATPAPPQEIRRARRWCFNLRPRTQVGGPFKPGDKIVAYTTPYGVSSMQLKTSTALVP